MWYLDECGICDSLFKSVYYTVLQLLPSASTYLPVWSRLPSQSCKIPNHRRLTLPTTLRGCFVVKFSNSGFHLACSLSADNNKYIIAVYSVSVIML
jgi:hypothetical protein